MRPKPKTYLVGGGIGSMSAAAFLIRDGGMAGEDISILEALPVMGGSLDGAGDPTDGYSLRGGRMLTTDNYECTWNLFKSIPSLNHAGKSVFDETVEFNEQARLVDRRRAKVPVSSMGFSMQDRMELLKLSRAEEASLGSSCITDWLSPDFFKTEFWFMWATTFAFQPWHSAVEFKRYLHRFMLEFSRIETLAGVKRTIYNQYDSMVLPLQAWLKAQGVRLISDCKVTNLDHKTEGGKFIVTGIHCVRHHDNEVMAVNNSDLVFLQNGSMTDASSLGSMAKCAGKTNQSGQRQLGALGEAGGRPPAVWQSCGI
jgi:oleate hydratase